MGSCISRQLKTSYTYKSGKSEKENNSTEIYEEILCHGDALNHEEWYSSPKLNNMDCNSYSPESYQSYMETPEWELQYHVTPTSLNNSSEQQGHNITKVGSTQAFNNDNKFSRVTDKCNSALTDPRYSDEAMGDIPRNSQFTSPTAKKLIKTNPSSMGDANLSYQPNGEYKVNTFYGLPTILQNIEHHDLSSNQYSTKSPVIQPFTDLTEDYTVIGPSFEEVEQTEVNQKWHTRSNMIIDNKPNAHIHTSKNSHATRKFQSSPISSSDLEYQPGLFYIPHPLNNNRNTHSITGDTLQDSMSIGSFTHSQEITPVTTSYYHQLFRRSWQESSHQCLGMREENNVFTYTAFAIVPSQFEWSALVNTVSRGLLGLSRRNQCTIELGNGDPYIHRGIMVQPLIIRGDNMNRVFRCRTALPPVLSKLLITPAPIKDEFNVDNGQPRTSKELHKIKDERKIVLQPITELQRKVDIQTL